jgi:peptidoglycan/xylan/chitin deacetylase (PgdA/CDA1 family)
MMSESSLTVLMYHAVLDQPRDPWSDPQYTVLRPCFRAQMQWLTDQAIQVCCVASQLLPDGSPHRRVAMTFDDGHVSNAWVAQVLASAGASADFFVNPARVGRPGFLGWSDLREMASWGMSIQSHGMAHRYLDEMTAVEADDDLRRSKAIIEDHVGMAVSLFAPPGGRHGPGLAGAARALGYRRVCLSRPGRWGRLPGQVEVPRMAVLATTDLMQWQRWVLQQDAELWRQRGRYALLAGAKAVLGNQRYERWRQVALRATPSAEASGGSP